MDDDGCLGYLIVIALGLVVIAVVVAVVFYAAVFIASIAGVAGIAYGGGLAFKNYGKSFKKNVFDSNHS